MSSRPKRSCAGVPASTCDDPPVPPEYGSVFRTAIIPEELDAVYGVPYLRAESRDTYLLVRLSGTSDDQGGLFRFVLLLPDRPPLLQCISLRGRFWALAQHTRITWSDLSAEEAAIVLDVLEDPPPAASASVPLTSPSPLALLPTHILAVLFPTCPRCAISICSRATYRSRLCPRSSLTIPAPCGRAGP